MLALKDTLGPVDDLFLMLRRAVVVLENMAHTLEQCRGEVPVRHVVVTSLGDMLPQVNGAIVDFVVRRVRKNRPSA